MESGPYQVYTHHMQEQTSACTRSVICPRHAWAFDLDNGYCDVISDYGVNVYDTSVTDEGIVRFVVTQTS